MNDQAVGIKNKATTRYRHGVNRNSRAFMPSAKKSFPVPCSSSSTLMKSFKARLSTVRSHMRRDILDMCQAATAPPRCRTPTCSVRIPMRVLSSKRIRASGTLDDTKRDFSFGCSLSSQSPSLEASTVYDLNGRHRMMTLKVWIAAKDKDSPLT